MKIRTFVDYLKNETERIPIIARCVKDGKILEADVSCSFHNDGDDWEDFSFVIKHQWDNTLDTDNAKYIMDYNLNAPDRKPSFFANYTPFEDYNLRITWECEEGCWRVDDVLDCSIEEKDGEKQFVLTTESLPDWVGDEDEKL